MRSFIYWFLLAALVALLAFASLYSIVPLAFLAGGIAIALIYVAVLGKRYRETGRWDHDQFQFRLHSVIFTYVVVFWTFIGLFTNNKTHREFYARYEPYIASDGRQTGYVFHYLDHPESYERVNSPDLNRYLEEKRPERVRMVLETVRDFGRLRSYSVAEIDGIAVNADWTAGMPPWEELR
jgi:hypothetical protein